MRKTCFKKRRKKIIAIDFFCSGGGMSYGLTQAGIDVIAGIDIDLSCKETYETNVPNSIFIHADITKFKEDELKKQVGIKKNDDNMIFVGCSPCQLWTIINTDKTKSQKSKNLLKDFQKFVKYYNPGYVVVENVPGILSKKQDSGLNDFIKYLELAEYNVEYKVINLNHYGVPQSRKRFSLIATRINEKPVFIESDKNKCPKVKDYIGEHNGFARVEAGHRDETEFIHTVSKLSDKNFKRIKKTAKNGGNRLAWANTKLQLKTYKKRSINSFKDTYGRISWDKPAPTITTKFYSISNGRFGHPEENRALSLREGATLQTFPKSFVFKTKTITATARIIGNAVPPEYARRIGETIINSNKGNHE